MGMLGEFPFHPRIKGATCLHKALQSPPMVSEPETESEHGSGLPWMIPSALCAGATNHGALLPLAGRSLPELCATMWAPMHCGVDPLLHN